MSASRIRPATAAESRVRLVQADADVVEQHRAYLLRVAGRCGRRGPGGVAVSGPAALDGSCFAIRDGQIAAIYDMVNPDKIGHTFGL